MNSHWSPARLLTAAVLAAWASLFWFLLLTDRSSLYLSSRTEWVIPLGAVVLSFAALGRLGSARVSTPERLDSNDVRGLAAIALPVVVVLALPPVALGSYAAARRSSVASAGFGAVADDIQSGDLSLLDVAGALLSQEGRKALVGRAGDDVSFTGFVARNRASAADEFLLTRFLVSCCVADALTVQVRVVGAPPGKFERDQWVRVTGQMYPLGREVIVDARDVLAVGRPEHPYLGR